MSKTEAREDVERIRQAREGNERESEEPAIIQCPLCGDCFLERGAVHAHVNASADHRGVKLNDSLDPVKKYRDEEELRKAYVEKELSANKMAEEWGCGVTTVLYWLEKHGIDRRSTAEAMQGKGRVKWASYCVNTGGYEVWQSCNPNASDDQVYVHQLLACVENDPEEVFAPNTVVHHRSGHSRDNRPENVELLNREEHVKTHTVDKWTEEDGIPTLVTQRDPDGADEPVESEGSETDESRSESSEREEAAAHDSESSRRWGPGDANEEDPEAGREYHDQWGPGVPTG